MERLADLTNDKFTRAHLRWLGCLALTGGVSDAAREMFAAKRWVDDLLDDLRIVDDARHRDKLRHKSAVAAGTVRDAVWAQPLAPVLIAKPFVSRLTRCRSLSIVPCRSRQSCHRTRTSASVSN